MRLTFMKVRKKVLVRIDRDGVVPHPIIIIIIRVKRYVGVESQGDGIVS